MEPSTARKHPFVGSWLFSALLFLTAVLIIAASLTRAANSDRGRSGAVPLAGIAASDGSVR